MEVAEELRQTSSTSSEPATAKEQESVSWKMLLATVCTWSTMPLAREYDLR